VKHEQRNARCSKERREMFINFTQIGSPSPFSVSLFSCPLIRSIAEVNAVSQKEGKNRMTVNKRQEVKRQGIKLDLHPDTK
jgi:hypothetical protein